MRPKKLRPHQRLSQQEDGHDKDRRETVGAQRPEHPSWFGAVASALQPGPPNPNRTTQADQRQESHLLRRRYHGVEESHGFRRLCGGEAAESGNDHPGVRQDLRPELHSTKIGAAHGANGQIKKEAPPNVTISIEGTQIKPTEQIGILGRLLRSDGKVTATVTKF